MWQCWRLKAAFIRSIIVCELNLLADSIGPPLENCLSFSGQTFSKLPINQGEITQV